MAHPYSGQARSSSASKFKGIVGRKSGGAVHSDEGQDRKLFSKLMKERKAEGGRVPGKAAGGRLDKAARGGVIKKNYGGALGAGMMPGAVPPPVGGLPPQAMGALPPQAMGGALPPQAMMGRPFKSGGAVKKDGGGKVVAIPFGLHKTADAISRLKAAGKTSDKDATEFATSRIKSHGIDPLPITGSSESRYKKGGRVKPSVNIIISAPGGDKQPAPLPAVPIGPPGLAAAGPPPVAPGGGPPPGLKPPGMMARGGRAHTGGDNGVGRLEKAAVAKRR